MTMDDWALRIAATVGISAVIALVFYSCFAMAAHVSRKDRNNK